MLAFKFTSLIWVQDTSFIKDCQAIYDKIAHLLPKILLFASQIRWKSLFLAHPWPLDYPTTLPAAAFRNKPFAFSSALRLVSSTIR